jgi:hypothetical protein
MVEAEEAGQTLFWAPLTPGVGVWGCNPAMKISCIEEYLHAKFHQDWCSGLDFYRGYTRTHTLTQLYDVFFRKSFCFKTLHLYLLLVTQGIVNVKTLQL